MDAHSTTRAVVCSTAAIIYRAHTYIVYTYISTYVPHADGVCTEIYAIAPAMATKRARFLC